LREKLAQFGRRLELRNRIELLERAGKRVRQASHGPCRKFLILGLEVEPVYSGQEALRGVRFGVHECRVEDQLGALVGDLCLTALLDLALHRLKVALDAIDSNRERIDQIEALGVLGLDRGEHA